MFGQDLSAWTAPEQVSVRYIRFAAAGQRAGPAKGAGAAQAARGPADVHGAASVRAGCDGTLWAIALLRQRPAASDAQGPITAGSTSVARSVKRGVVQLFTLSCCLAFCAARFWRSSSLVFRPVVRSRPMGRGLCGSSPSGRFVQGRWGPAVQGLSAGDAGPALNREMTSPGISRATSS